MGMFKAKNSSSPQPSVEFEESLDTVNPTPFRLIQTLRVRDFSLPRKKSSGLEDVSLELLQGCCVGIFGSAGSGKTSLLSGLLGFEKKAKATVFYYGQAMPLQLHRLVSNNCRTFPQDIPYSIKKWVSLMQSAVPLFSLRRFHRFLEESGLHLHQMVTELSCQEFQLLCMIMALSSEASVFFLEEPVHSFDISHQALVRRWLLELLQEEHSVLLTTAFPQEVEGLVDFAGFLVNGRLLDFSDAYGLCQREGHSLAQHLQILEERACSDTV